MLAITELHELETGRVYSSPEVCRLSGCTYRQLDYWIQNGLMRASIRDARGSGSARLFSGGDVLLARFLKSWGSMFVQGSDIYGPVRRLGPVEAVAELRRTLATLEELLPDLV